MKLWISSEAWADVGTALSKASNNIEQLINETLSNGDYGQGIRQWSFIAIVLPPHMHEAYPERFKYHMCRGLTVVAQKQSW
jgi:hypothetical protein